MNYSGKQALVLGLGESGLAMARWLARCGAAVRVADTRETPERLEQLLATVPDAQFVAGPFHGGLVAGMDIVAVSPGLSPARELLEIEAAAGAAGIVLWGEIELFAQALAVLRSAPAPAGADGGEDAAAAGAAQADAGIGGVVAAADIAGEEIAAAEAAADAAENAVANATTTASEANEAADNVDHAPARIAAETMVSAAEAGEVQCADGEAAWPFKVWDGGKPAQANPAAQRAAAISSVAATSVDVTPAAAATADNSAADTAGAVTATVPAGHWPAGYSEDDARDADVAPAPAPVLTPIVSAVDPGYRPRVIAITGTNGKTTVTSLAGLLCQRAGQSVRVAGNISPAALDVLREALDADSLPDVWVLELSSFQLHYTHSLRADAATVLNLSQDHLDWHGDMAAYVADKARIFGANTVRVLNRDDALSMQMASTRDLTLSFGADEPATADSLGLLRENGMVWLALATPAEEPEKKRRRRNAPQDAVPVFMTRLMPADALKIRGQHNAANALAALGLCRAIGLPLAPLLHGLRDYRGEPHRVELVSTLAEVAYYDDSKGTNVGATVAAVKGLGAELGEGEGRLLLIAGGVGKGQDFSPLAIPVGRHARCVFLIGRDAPLLRAALSDSGVELVDAATLEEAVEGAAARARSGDAVLLSPACASFDMFRDYVERAEKFVDAVREVAFSRGEVMA